MRQHLSFREQFRRGNAPLNDSELIDRQPVIVLRPLEIDHLRLGAGNRSDRPGVLDIDAVDEHAMQRAVAGPQVRRFHP